MGHAVVMFDTIGQLIQKPKVDFVQLWNTRWVDNDTASPAQLWDAVDRLNQFYPTGRALAIWGQYLQDQMVSTTSTAMVRSYASYTPGSRELSIFLINKDTISRSTVVTVQNFSGTTTGTKWIFKGTGSEDLAPTWSNGGAATISSGKISTTLNPVSVTVLHFAAANAAPTVSITAPSNGATFGAPASVSIQAAATDSNGTVSKVEFFAGSSLISSDSSSPYTAAWNNVSQGTYSLTARATDNGGATSTSSSVNVNVTNTGTTTSSGFKANINFQPASAAVPSGYLADGGAIYGSRGNGHTYGWNADNSANARERNAANAPDQRYDTFNHMQKGATYTWDIAVPNGSYTVKVVAGDASFFDGDFRINVEGVLIVSGSPSSTNPWVEGTKTVTVSDGKLSVSNGTGAVNNKICFIDITAIASSNLAPVVNLTNPAAGSTYLAPANITASATASDSDGTISQLEFFSGSTLFGSDLSSPYSVTWNNVAAGSYSLTAKATDNGGASSTSSAVSITVHSTTNTSVSGNLTVTKGSQPASLSLNLEGTRDWSHWGLNSATDWNHKSGVSSQGLVARNRL